jgi:hypothetical protein
VRVLDTNFTNLHESPHPCALPNGWGEGVFFVSWILYTGHSYGVLSPESTQNPTDYEDEKEDEDES